MLRRTKRSGKTRPVGLTASYLVNETHNTGFAHALIWIVAGALVALLYWAAMTPVYEVVSGQGQIRPEGLTTRVEHLEGGMVDHIAVRDGDTVDAGDVLLTLDASDLLAERAKLAAQATFVALSLDRYQRLLDLQIADANAVQALMALSGEDARIDENIRFRLSQIAAMRAQIDVNSAQTAALTGQLSLLQQEYQIQNEQRERIVSSTSGAITVNRREELERESLRLQSALSQMQGEIKIKSASASSLAANEAELIAQFRSDAATRRQELLAEEVRVTQSIAQLDERIARLTVRANVAGRIGAMIIQNKGEVIPAGEPLMEIVPTAPRNVAEIEIPADQIGGVSVGSEASLKVLTFDFTRYGDITALVDRISPNSYRTEDGQNMYRVQLSFPDADGPPHLEVSPGMTVVADIKSDRRTILSYLLKPVRVLTDRAFTEA